MHYETGIFHDPEEKLAPPLPSTRTTVTVVKYRASLIKRNLSPSLSNNDREISPSLS